MTSSSKWDSLHKFYSQSDWISKANIFANEVLEYLPEKGSILCLGDGQGQDSRFFAQKGFTVNSTDISETALKINRQETARLGLKNVSVQKLDLTGDFPFPEHSFDVVYAHLSLHYFSQEETVKIFGRIKNVLKKGGIFAAFVNSVNDPEFNTGTRIEQEYFEIDGIRKRFFSVYSMDFFAKDFRPIILDDLGRTYKDEAKGVSNLVRFIGKNYSRRELKYALPVVSAIIEREGKGEKEILIQTRWRPGGTKEDYHGTIEIVNGVLDSPFENVLDTVRREVKEETGLEVSEIVNLVKTEKLGVGGDKTFAFTPFTAFQQLKNGLPWVGFAFVCRVKAGEPKFQEEETRDVRWIKVSELKRLLTDSPEKFFTLNLGPLAVYLKE